MRKFLYPGSFDPPTKGHYDIVKRSLKICDKMVIGIHGGSLTKKYWFSAAEREDLFRSYFTPEESSRIEVVVYEALTADLARDVGAIAIIRGLRTNSDFEFEFSMAAMNKQLNHELETLFIRTSDQHAHISSSLVKDVFRFRPVEGMVSEAVKNALRERIESYKSDS